MSQGEFERDFQDQGFKGFSVDDVIAQLNSLLRGEIAAAETYRMAIDKAENNPSVVGVGLLRGIQEEHVRSCNALRDRIRELGGEPEDSSGAWGAWAKMSQGAASIFGEISAFKALREGEDEGLRDYRDAVDEVDLTTSQLLENQCIPAQERHIALLDQLISTKESA